MKNYSTILLMAAMISMIGCYTENKALKDLNKAYDMHPNVVAKYSAEHFPCIGSEVVKYDTSYDFVEIQCPDVNENSQVNDTIYLTKYIPRINSSKHSKVVAIPTKTIIKTIKVVNNAELNVSEFRLEQCESEKNDYIDKVVQRGNWIKWLLILLALSLVGNIILIRK